MAGPFAYLDSSAIVKLIVDEPERDALTAVLRNRPLRVSSALSQVEVLRSVRKLNAGLLPRARQVLSPLALLQIDNLLDSAASVAPVELRSLDAIHLAAALSLGDDLGAFIAYDRRLMAAAEQAGLPTLSPR